MQGGNTQGPSDAIYRRLKQEFIDGCDDMLDDLERYAFLPAEELVSVIPEIRRTVHNIRGSSRLFGYSGLDAVTRHLESYLGAVTRFDSAFQENFLSCIDRMRLVVMKGENLSPDELASILREMPAVIANGDTTDVKTGANGQAGNRKVKDEGS